MKPDVHYPTHSRPDEVEVAPAGGLGTDIEQLEMAAEKLHAAVVGMMHHLEAVMVPDVAPKTPPVDVADDSHSSEYQRRTRSTIDLVRHITRLIVEVNDQGRVVRRVYTDSGVVLGISRDELEAARVAFVEAWEATNDAQTFGTDIGAPITLIRPGDRSRAGLIAALEVLKIVVDRDHLDPKATT